MNFDYIFMQGLSNNTNFLHIVFSGHGLGGIDSNPDMIASLLYRHYIIFIQ